VTSPNPLQRAVASYPDAAQTLRRHFLAPWSCRVSQRPFYAAVAHALGDPGRWPPPCLVTALAGLGVDASATVQTWRALIAHGGDLTAVHALLGAVAQAVVAAAEEIIERELHAMLDNASP